MLNNVRRKPQNSLLRHTDDKELFMLLFQVGVLPSTCKSPVMPVAAKIWTTVRMPPVEEVAIFKWHMGCSVCPLFVMYISRIHVSAKLKGSFESLSNL